MLCSSNIIGYVFLAILLSIVNNVQSQYVRHPEIHRSVVLQKVKATWDEAKRRCEAEGAVMASPLDKEMFEYMKMSTDINNDTTPYFIGFKATGNPELNFVSVEGVPLDNLPEAAMNMIEQLDPQDGDCLSMDRHNIRVVSCEARLPYICYKNDTSTSTTATPVNMITTSEPEGTTGTSENCSLGYTNLLGSYYKVHKEPATWSVAQEICSTEGGYLAVINNMEEATAVIRIVYNIGINDWVWIFTKMSDREENSNWRSVLGNPLNQILNIWERYIDFNDFNCASLNKEAYIVDVDCTQALSYVCESYQSITGYSYLLGSYYKLHKKPASWDEAQQTCIAEGGYLAVINDFKEAQVIIKFGSSNNEELQIHTGLRREKYGIWKSVLGHRLHQIYNEWSITISFNCLQGDIFDVKCSWDFPYVCEKKC